MCAVVAYVRYNSCVLHLCCVLYYVYTVVRMINRSQVTRVAVSAMRTGSFSPSFTVYSTTATIKRA